MSYLTHEDDGMMGQFIVKTPCDISITNQQADTIYKLESQNVLLSINGTSTQPLNYQWQSDLGFGFQNLTNAGQYSNVTNDTLLITNLTTLNNNQLIRCIVTNSSCSDTSNIYVLKVDLNNSVYELNKNFKYSFNNKIFHIEYPSKIDGEYEMYSMEGKKLISEKIISNHIDLKNMKSGFYVLKIKKINKSVKIFISE